LLEQRRLSEARHLGEQRALEQQRLKARFPGGSFDTIGLLDEAIPHWF